MTHPLISFKPNVHYTNPKSWKKAFWPTAEWLSIILDALTNQVHLEDFAKTHKSFLSPPQKVHEKQTRNINALPKVEITFIFTSNKRIQHYNKTYRKKDTPTNVLSFPLHIPAFGEEKAVLGEVILALETLLKESQNQQKTFAHHLAHLIIHGVLHLLGFDHQTPSEAKEMAQQEARILSSLGIANPYERNTVNITPHAHDG